ncbi:GDSL Lipase/Acylhydrolase family protein [Aspergillus unguis]
MKSLTSLMIALAATPTLTLSAPTHHQKGLVKKFSSLVVFGDSYTDNGVYSYTPPVANQSTERSTGGRVWPDYIQQYTGVNLYDYAVSGAVCDAVIANDPRNGIKQDQLASFDADAHYRDEQGKPALLKNPKETVYTVWIGTNDLGYAGFLTEVQPKGMALRYFTDCVYEVLDAVYAAGGRAFVLLNMAPLDLGPEYGLPENGGLEEPDYWEDKTGYDKNITRSSEKMRQYLGMVNAVFDYQTPYEVLSGGRYPGSSFAVFDVHSLMTDMWHHPGRYLNGTVEYNVTGSVTGCGDACEDSDVRDSYLWYDTLHPSEQTDRVIAREFVNVVKGESKWAKMWRN